MFRRGAIAKIGGQGFCGRGWRSERAKTVEHAQRRHGFHAGFARDAGAGVGGIAGDIDDPSQHLDKTSRHRQVRPAHVGADMEQADHALAAMLAGDQRRAVFQRGPAPLRQRRIRFGQHLPVDGDVLRHGKARKRAVGREGCQVLRLFPGQAAAEAASAAAQFYRHQIVVALGQPRAGKAHQHAALLDPGIDAFANFRRQRADIGQHDHRQLLVEELRDRLLRRAAIAEPHVGERRQRTGEIESRGQQRLRGIAGRSRDDADGAAAPALVEQLHRAGGALAGDFQPRDIVAQFDRKIERRLGLAVPRRKAVAGLADRRAFLVKRTDDAGGDAAALGAQHLHRHPGRGVFGRDQGQRRRGAARINCQNAIPDGLAQGFDELRSAPGIDAVGQPGDLGIAGRFQETLDGSEGFHPLDRIGFGNELAQRHPRRARRHQGDVAGGLRQGHQRDAAAVVVGVGNQFIGGLDPDVPARSRAPAVVEQDQQRCIGAGHAGLRIPDRACGCQDHQRRGGEPQRGQPPRRARGGLFLRRDIEQQPRRRKLDPPRPGRHDPQQPPQRRQAQEAQQQKRFGEREREPGDHALRPTLTVLPRALPLLTIMPECRNNSSSAAERLVVWVENSQSSLLVSARISSRCSATRVT